MNISDGSNSNLLLLQERLVRLSNVDIPLGMNESEFDEQSRCVSVVSAKMQEGKMESKLLEQSRVLRSVIIFNCG